VVIVDRKEQDGRKKVENEGLTVLSLLTVDDLIRQQPVSQQL
jgi:orotate phosphoribosyltransferase